MEWLAVDVPTNGAACTTQVSHCATVGCHPIVQQGTTAPNLCQHDASPSEDMSQDTVIISIL